MSKTSLTTALLQGRCPRCRQGDIFQYPLSKVTRFNVMNPVCPHCGVGFEPEPGFYQGAMYVGYAITIAVMVAVSLALSVLGDYSEWTYIGWMIGLMLLLVPLNYRYSRIIYLHAFGGIRFDSRYAQ
jgi:uncharacterized protein (DUF983 family)